MAGTLHHDYLPSANWAEFELLGLRFWSSSVLQNIPGLTHAFTPLGYNMSQRSGADAGTTRFRYRELCRELQLDYTRLVWPEQTHGDAVAAVSVADTGMLPTVDGLITNTAGTVLMSFSADCPLVALYDRSTRAIGVAHSGRAGTLLRIPEKLVNKMNREYGCRSENLIAVITPGAKACCYEIGEDVYRALGNAPQIDKLFVRYDCERTYLDLIGYIAFQLLEVGLDPSSIHLPQHCTICDHRFHSYRRQGPGNGHGALLVSVGADA